VEREEKFRHANVAGFFSQDDAARIDSATLSVLVGRLGEYVSGCTAVE